MYSIKKLGNGGDVYLNNGIEKGGVMEELELDYVIVKLKKKSPRSSEEKS